MARSAVSRRALAALSLLAVATAGAACMASYGVGERGPRARLPFAAERAEPSPAELRLGELLANHPDQRRRALRWSPVLARVAREKATDMARRGYFAHVDPDGIGANTLLRRAGYALPPGYDARPAGNNVESLGRGYDSPDAVWGRWMGSRAHRTHLLGLNPVFETQEEYGVAYEPNGMLWVVIIAGRAG